MMKFEYTGMTRQKERVRGSVEAVDEIEARNKLRSMQVRPNTLVVKKGGGGISFNLPNFKEISLGKPIDMKGMLVFTRQFSSLVDAGVPMKQCLEILWQQEKRPPFKKVLGRVKDDIEAGSGLAESLGKHPRVFSDLFIRLVEAGEVSGTLDKALKRIGLQLEKLDRIRAKVKAAMIYPIITLVVAVGVLLFLLIKVIPEISKMYGESNAKLPELTLKVLALSNWIQHEYYKILVGIALMVVAVLTLPKVNAFRKVFDPVVLRFPLFGPLIKKVAIARFSRTMSTLVSSGVPLLNGFDICIKLISNLAIKNILSYAKAVVQEGKTIAQGLSHKDLFPPMVIHMVSIGEMTGKLDELLGKVAEIYDDEVDDAVTNLTGLIQPVLIVFVGGIIAFLLIAMYLPIFQLAEKVTGGA